MRTGVEIKGESYLGMRLSGSGTGGGGRVVKWTGTKEDPFQFEIVSPALPHEVGYITEHDGRLVTGDWGTLAPRKAVGGPAEMMQSRPLPEHGGLTNADATSDSWKEIWNLGQYEPDPTIAQVGEFGAMTSWKGKLIFSTMWYPSMEFINSFTAHGTPTSEIERLQWAVNANRALQVFDDDRRRQAQPEGPPALRRAHDARLQPDHQEVGDQGEQPPPEPQVRPGRLRQPLQRLLVGVCAVQGQAPHGHRRLLELHR
jgi:hypothetical protein